jgi:integrase
MKSKPITRFDLQYVGENLYRNKSSGIYYALFKRDGKQIRKSLKTADKAMARRYLGDLRGQVQRLTTAEAKSLPFAEYEKNDNGEETRLVGGLAGRWLNTAAVNLKPSSLDRRLRTIHSLTPFFKNKSVGSIGKLDVERWAAQRVTQCKPRTFNMELETLNLCFKYAMEHGILLENPAAHIRRRKVSKPRLTVPTRQQFKELLTTIRQCRTMTKACAEDEAAANLIEFLAYSGCRLAEAVGDRKFEKDPITWADIDFDMHTFTVTGKGSDGGKTRTVPLFPPLERLLLNLKAKLATPLRPADPIFTIQSAKKAIETACRRLGLPHYHHHTFRHFFASNAIEHGIDFKVIAEWLGHADGCVLVARTYGHLRAEHSAAMAKRMVFDAVAELPDNVVELPKATTR